MRRMSIHLSLALLVLLTAQVCGADEWANIRVHVEASDKVQLKALMDSDLDTHHFHGMGTHATVTQAQLDDLRAQGYRVAIETTDEERERQTRLGGGFLPEYTSYSEAAAELSALATAFPALTQLTSIGQSLEGREMWALKISDNAAVDENEPEVLICGNHHAREVISVIIPLHVATTLLNGYGTDPDATDWIDNREIWIIPVVNPDGLVYVETTNLNWRKNRRGGYGVDLNRNYDAEWGHDNNGSSGSTGSSTYRGASPASEPEVANMQTFINSRNFVIHLSYHSYGNLLLWGPGYKPGLSVDEDILTGLGQIVSAQNSYTPGNPANGAIYIVNGDTDDFAYGSAGHTSYLGLTPEVGTSSDGFAPSAARIPTLTTEGSICAWEALRYAPRLGQLAPPGQPATNPIPLSTNGSFDVTWNTPTTADTQPVRYEVVEKTGPSVVADGAEGGLGAFNAGGWTQSSSRQQSGSFSFYSGSGDELNRIMLSKEAYVVQPGDFFTFDAWYSIESNWDYAYAVLSTDGGRSIVNLAGTNTTMSDPNGNNADNGITGSSGGWIPMSFDLSPWVGQSVNLGVRYYTDGGVANEGIYVDNVFPVQNWGSSTSLTTTNVPTTFAVAGKADGTYYYAVRGQDAEGDWGYWSANESAVVQTTTDIRPSEGLRPFALSAAIPNPFAASTDVRFTLPSPSEHSLTVFDVSGRRVRTLSSGRLPAGPHTVSWDGLNDTGRSMPSGVYFLSLRADAGELRQRAVLQR
ncbi:MAG: hypothetical protein DHS20C21_18850 [Gemmatimonadota bacterium]|nr:MAG: hypothetical protein DHS20C21_18850 [Gemmatimonadota bacterium]